MQRILLGLGTIAVLGGLVAGGSGAFFSDTESSTNNTFTAGALDLRVDSESHYNGLICRNIGTSVPEYKWLEPLPGPATPEQMALNHYNKPCTGTWAESDLIEDSLMFRFFNFDDVKPGDTGENTISLHVYNNDAWGCFLVNNVENADNSCTEPEEDAVVDACMVATPEGATLGELGSVLTFDAWLDQGAIDGFQNIGADGQPVDADAEAAGVQKPDPTEGDNIFQAENEGPKFWDDETVNSASAGPFAIKDVLSAAYASNGCVVANGNTDYGVCHGLALDGRMVGSATYYFGLEWNVPASAGNEIQTDSLIADMNFEIAQHRNNPNFSCTPRTEEPATATVTVDKVVTFTSDQIAGVDVTDFTLTIDGPGAPIVVTDEVATAGLPTGTYTISEVYSNVPAGVTFDATFSGGCSEVGNTGVGTMNVVAGVNPTCVITNAVTPPVIN